jgi:hypothetical protein
MKQLLPITLASLVLAIVHADTIRLRDGKELEGTVVSETDTEYVVRVEVTRSIREQRRIPKNTVLDIVREEKDETAFEELKGLVPTPDRLDVEAYEARIGRVEAFIGKFPESSRIPEAAKILDTLEVERDVVAAGGVKFEGELLAAADHHKRAFTLDSLIVEAEFNDAIAEGNRTAALRVWDKLTKEFPTSRAYVRNIPRAIEVMRVQLAAVDSALETLDDRVEERSAKLASLRESDRARARKAHEQQSADYLRRIEAEREQGIRWISLDPFEKAPLSAAKSMLQSEIQRLENLDTSRLPDGDEAWKAAWKALDEDAASDAARAAVANARSARLPQRYLEMLEARLPAK